MDSPRILGNLQVRKVNSSEFGIFTSDMIEANSIIEYCTWLPITRRAYILLQKSNQTLVSNLFDNPDGIDKELEITNKLVGLDLQSRLDKGLITMDQFRSILTSAVNQNAMLDIVSHAILLGFGSIYRKSNSPNINYSYDSATRLYKFFAVNDIYKNQELTYFSNL